MDTHPEPKLAAPGAGLPRVELFVARLLFALRRRKGNRRSFDSLFNRERETIRGLIRNLEAEKGSCRVLIRRPPGLEDSSRYWSVWMTLDHLRIVHHAFAQIIGSLSRGLIPEGQASTAAVKPNAEVGASIVSEYESSCDALLSVVASIPDLNTAVRYPHPWFGPLNAAGWHALAGIHLGIHRVQIERILNGLRAKMT